MKKTRLILLSIVLVLLGIATSNAQEKLNTEVTFTKIDTYLSNGEANGFSGAILVIKEGELIINKGYGLANKKSNTLNNPNTIFDIGSNTKQFTSSAILKLVEQNKLSVTDSLNKYFSELPIDKQSITIHQLLTHSAGFSESIGRDFSDISQKDFFDKLFASKLLSEPGEKYSYSNTGYSILGRIIELASGQSYEAFLKAATRSLRLPLPCACGTSPTALCCCSASRAGTSCARV